MPNGPDLWIVAIPLISIVVVFWCLFQLQALNRRLTSLEKQHLALIADLEDRLFETRGPG